MPALTKLPPIVMDDELRLDKKWMRKLANSLESKGPGALGPLKPGRVWYAMYDGEILLFKGEWGPQSSFKTKKAALKHAEGFGKYLRGEDT